LGDAWSVDFNDGHVSSHDKDGDYFVRCVRIGPLDLGNFGPLIFSGDRVVTDSAIGLMWQGCSAGQSGSNCSAGSAISYNWQQALAYCEGLSWGGFDDWRLPSIAELDGIVDVTKYNPAIDSVVFPGTPSDYWFWSSTSRAADQDDAWNVHFNNGQVYCEAMGKGGNFYVRCVRLGP
jgi:hypothetical protein